MATLNFGKFDQYDQEVFAGAEGWEDGNPPMVCEEMTVNVHGTKFETTTVLDVTGIEVMWTDDEGDVHSYKMNLVAPFVIALGVASNLPRYTNATNLETLGFVKILG